MSNSSRKNIAFRFKRKNHDAEETEEQVQETEEEDADDDQLFDASMGASSLQSFPFTNRANSNSSNSNNNQNHSSGSKWLNESWRKFTQIVEEHKEKANRNKDVKPTAVYREMENLTIESETVYCDDREVRVETGATIEYAAGTIEDEEVFMGEEVCEEDAPNAFDLSVENDLPTNLDRSRSLSDRTPESKRFSLFSRFRNDTSDSNSPVPRSESNEMINKAFSKFFDNDLKPSTTMSFKSKTNQVTSSSPSDSISNSKNPSPVNSVLPSPSAYDEPLEDFLPSSLESQPIISKSNDFSKKSNNQTETESESDPFANYLLNSIIIWCRSKFNLQYFLATSVAIFSIIAFVQISPFSDFANGFFLGLAFAFFNVCVLIAYALSKVFQKLDSENQTHRKVMSGQKWKTMPAFAALPTATNNNLVSGSNTSAITSSTSISSSPSAASFEGWFYELVYSKKFGIDKCSSESIDRCESTDTKARLIYIRLENNLLRVFTPKDDQIKKPPLTDDRIHFYKHSSKMNQHIYDFSLMDKARVSLWLPKNIRNKQKYLWIFKYPLILTLQETNRLAVQSERSTIKLILFARTNRDKEEWYSRFRSSIESCENLHKISTTQSTPEEKPKNDHIARTLSLDIGEWNNHHHQEFEHLDSLLAFEPFMQEILQQFTSQDSFNSSSANITIPKRMPTSTSAPNGFSLLWFNAIVGRILFDFLTHPHWTKWVQFKIQRKLSRLKLPYFIQTLNLKDVHLGHSVPKFISIPNELTFNEKGLWIDMEMEYQGCFTMTFETKLDLMRLKDSKSNERELKPMQSSTSMQTLNSSLSAANVSSATIDTEAEEFSDPESIVDLSDDESDENWSIESDSSKGKFVKYLDKIASSNFFQHATENKFVKRKMEEVSNMPLLLTVTLQELRGILTINLPRPSSDRLWYGFRDNPKLVLEAQPAFGERVVSLTHISQWIAKKLKQEFNKLLVIPNMDDITIQPMMSGDVQIDETLL